MSITFDVCSTDKSFKLNTDDFKYQIDTLKCLTNKINLPFNDHSDIGNLLPSGKNSFVSLISSSFANHRHLYLSPDDVWLVIEHGLALHIKENSEELRKHFVSFEGKATIEVQRDNFVYGAKNDWEGCFDEFSEKIGEFIGKKKDLIVSKFSTTSQLQRVASEIVLMDAMSNYFNYLEITMCGIPSVTLEGSVEDWENIRSRVDNFDEFGLSWWTAELRPVLDEFVKSAKGNRDLSFWKSFYNEGGGSGGPYIDGHIIKLFPYFENYNGSFVKNNFGNSDNLRDSRFSSYNFPASFSKVPFLWDYHGDKYTMEFIGGIIGVKEHEKGVKSAYGWAVCDSAIPISKYPVEKLEKGMILMDKNKRVGKLLRAEIMEYDDKSYNKLTDIRVDWGDSVEDISKNKDYFVFEGIYVKGQNL